MVIFWIPVRVVSEANQREHWSKRARRAKAQRRDAAMCAESAGVRGLTAPLTVRLIRVAPRKLDSDNLAGAFKAVRDGIADVLGVDDGSELVKWEYAQEHGGKGVYSAKAEITR